MMIAYFRCVLSEFIIEDTHISPWRTELITTAIMLVISFESGDELMVH